MPLRNTDIPFHVYKTDVDPSTGADIYVRESVISSLNAAQKELAAFMPGFKLQVFYGYRAPEVQQKSFEKIRRDLQLDNDFSDAALEKIHHYIAVPEVAGHPTGGAVDILLLDPEGQPLDMGTLPHAFERDSYVFSPFISEQAQKNRQILRKVMMKAEFAPFDGEWWHFSYGDREWAAYWGKPYAFYGQAKGALGNAQDNPFKKGIYLS